MPGFGQRGEHGVFENHDDRHVSHLPNASILELLRQSSHYLLLKVDFTLQSILLERQLW